MAVTNVCHFRSLAIAVLAAALLLAACAGGSTSSSSSASASAGAAGPSDAELVSIGAGLQGQPGLTASVYAQGLTHASALTFDDQGRLWVATADYADSGADGVYVVPAAGAAPVEVVAGLHTPLGLLWIGGALYVSGTGGVEAHRGFDGTAFAEHSTVLSLPADVGEVNGMALAPDGRIWMGISAPCDHCTPDSPYSASVVSFLPDGTGLRVEASGIRAAIGLAFLPGSGDLFVTMNQRDDLGDTTPGDWVSLVASGQAWGFPDCYGQGDSGCEAQPAPVAELDAHAAVSGIALLTTPYGAAAGSSAVVAEWATGKVVQVELGGGGATTAETPTTLVTGITKPMPVVVTPTGSVLVGDWATGTVYELRG